MSTVVLVLPILPDREEEWRRFVQDLEDRPGEYEDFARRMGIRSMKVCFTRTGRRAVITARVEVEDPDEASQRLAASKEPFDEWFKEKLMELHGFEVGSRMGSQPELVFEYPEGRGSP